MAALLLRWDLANAGSLRGADRDSVPRIAILSAFEPELKILLTDLKSPQATDIHGQRFTTGQLQGQDVVLLLSGISMVNAAMSTQRAIDNFNVKAIVFSGIAGGVDPGLAIGDVVVADQWGSYLESVFARETAPGSYALPPFLRTDKANFGMIFPRTTEVTRDGLAAPERRFWFPVDAALLSAARKLSDDATAAPLERCASADKCLAHQPRLVVGGNGVSGSAFMDNAAMRDFLFKTLQARVLDMESAATAQVAYANGVPFIAFRSLSDLAGGDDRHNEMATFLTLASSNSAKTVQAFLAALPKPALTAAPNATAAQPTAPADATACATLGGEALLEARLFFGRNIGNRVGVSEADWRGFLDKEVTPRFPDGLTAQDAAGQWRDSDTGRLVREPSKLLTLLAPNQPATLKALADITAAYKKRFRQQAVGTVLRTSCVAF